jgi:hypothetical protein
MTIFIELNSHDPMLEQIKLNGLVVQEQFKDPVDFFSARHSSLPAGSELWSYPSGGTKGGGDGER